MTPIVGISQHTSKSRLSDESQSDETDVESVVNVEFDVEQEEDADEKITTAGRSTSIGIGKPDEDSAQAPMSKLRQKRPQMNIYR